jgi:hypothetical protein
MEECIMCTRNERKAQRALLFVFTGHVIDYSGSVYYITSKLMNDDSSAFGRRAHNFPRVKTLMK